MWVITVTVGNHGYHNFTTCQVVSYSVKQKYVDLDKTLQVINCDLT